MQYNIDSEKIKEIDGKIPPFSCDGESAFPGPDLISKF
jgi:hypothetical protein